MVVGTVVAGAQSVVSCTTWHIHKHRHTCANVAEGKREKEQGPAVNSRSARMHHYYKFHATSLRRAVAAATLTLMAHCRRRRLGSVMAATATQRLPRQPAAVTGTGAVVHICICEYMNRTLSDRLKCAVPSHPSLLSDAAAGALHVGSHVLRETSHE